MATQTFPSVGIRDSSWEIISNQRVFVSPFTQARQTSQRGGTRWRVTLNTVPLNKADRASMQAFISRVTARAEPFTLTPDAYTQRGAGGGTPLVAGGSQTGYTLNIDGATAGVTGWLKAGDYFEVEGELKQITEDIDTSGTGTATLVFAPELRDAPADNAAITLSSPTGIFRLAQPGNGWSNRSPALSEFSLICIEDVLA